MAADQVALMRALGHDRFAVVGHDRGARVAHRMALDHPDAVTRLAVLDIVPTLHVYEHVDKALATAYYHWFFFIQPAPVPERLIDGDPIGYLHALLGAWGSGLSVFAPEALARVRALLRRRRRPARDAARTTAPGASIDLEHDRADVDRKVEVPMLVVWGGRGVVGTRPEIRSTSGADGRSTCAARPSTPGTSSSRSSPPRRSTCSTGSSARPARPGGTRGTRRPQGPAAGGA